MSEEDLKARINDLENELEQKNGEINTYLDRIDELENNIMKLEALIEESETEGSFDPQKVQETKLSIQLKERERELRQLKNKMGFLRKEKIELQNKLEQQEYQPKKESTVIRIKEKTETSPFDGLVKELQTKINKQQTLINQLRENGTVTPESELQKRLSLKDKTIEELESKIIRLEEELESAQFNSTGSDAISKSLTEELQDRLHKTRRRALYLQERLSKYEEVEDILGLRVSEENSSGPQKKIQELKKKLNDKNKTIENLKETISDLQESQSESISTGIHPGTGMISELNDELQKKLNKAKIRIQKLENELKTKTGNTISKSLKKNEIEEVISDKESIIEELRATIQSKDDIIKNKQEEIETIKNEAMKCNSEIEKLKETLNLKEDQIEKLQYQVESLQKNFDLELKEKEKALSLRVKELKNMVKELKKQNAQQLLEISELRK